MGVQIHHGDCLDVVRGMADASVDSVVTDPPYALVSIVKRFGKPGAAPAKGDVYARAGRGFMGKQWDTGETAFAVEFWAEILRILKPGGHVVAFSGTRTYHRLACAIEDAGFEIRDQLQWLYGTGFPKSHSVSKGIARHFDVDREVIGKRIRPGGKLSGGNYVASQPRQNSTEYVTVPASQEAVRWDGWGTALKPAVEPICMARKPLDGTVAENVLTHGTGAINVDGCRIETDEDTGRHSFQRMTSAKSKGGGYGNPDRVVHHRIEPIHMGGNELGRWPANVLHDGSDDVSAAFGTFGDRSSPWTGNPLGHGAKGGKMFGGAGQSIQTKHEYADNGTASRFFFSAKADTHDRFGSKHPTVKPIDLMRWLCRLITPPGGVVLDPFAGSGTTGVAAMAEGFNAILIEREDEYVADIRARIEFYKGLGGHSMSVKNRSRQVDDLGPLFGSSSGEGMAEQ